MGTVREEIRVGIDSVECVTTLLQRTRSVHPTAGLYQAADFQWWWRTPRSSDDLGQLVWFDAAGRPEAAVTFTDWGGGRSAVYEDVTIAVIVMPDASCEWLAHVVDRGLAHARAAGIEAVEIEIDRADSVTRDVLTGHGFEVKENGVVEAWLDADDRPEISPLHDGYRLACRLDTTPQPHHMIGRSGPAVEERLLQTSLYRADLDLVVFDHHDDVAAYGLFWFDPVTAAGLVEPMRTEDAHQRRGLARHVLTAGLDLLAKAGAERISIGYEPANPASGHLYRSVGFEPVKQTDVFARR
ncbi:MAG: GNAT family N-acetyltransferase [Ilumatobacteraceae bacterium]